MSNLSLAETQGTQWMEERHAIVSLDSERKPNTAARAIREWRRGDPRLSQGRKGTRNG